MGKELFDNIPSKVGDLLSDVKNGKVGLPDLQRPFVWKRSQVRDLIDSLYNGYPTGYIITWKNPDVHTKDGSVANGKHVLIDGQQRITTIMLMFLAMYKLLNEGRLKSEDEHLKERILETFLIERFNKGDDKYNATY